MDYSHYAYLMGKYIEDASKVKESYDNAKDGIIKEYEDRKRVFQDVDERFKQIEEGFSRGEVKKNAYNKLKKERERAEKNLQELTAKLDEINKFMNERLNVVVTKLESLKQNYNEEIEDETNKLKYQILKAKYDFLTSVIEIRKTYGNLRKRECKLQDLNKEFGPQTIITAQNAFQLLSPAVIDESGAAISKDELYDALHSGKVSSQLEESVIYAKKHGLI
jgi:archaellum component FlaC